MDTGVTGNAATRFAYGINLVENYYVKTAVRAELLLLLLGIGEEPPDIGLALADKFVEDLRPVDYLRFPGVQHRADLTSHQSFTGTGRSVQQDTTDVLAAQLHNDLRWKYSRRESTSEYSTELLVQTTNAHFREVPVGIYNRLTHDLALRLADEIQARVVGFFELYDGVAEATTHTSLLRLRVLTSLYRRYIGCLKTLHHETEHLLVGELERQLLTDRERLTGELKKELFRHLLGVIRVQGGSETSRMVNYCN